MTANDATSEGGAQQLGTLQLGTQQMGTLPDSTVAPADRHSGPVPTITGFELLGELGRGGVGVVYKARQIALNRLVAIKMLSGQMQSQPEVLARFRTEAQAVARLQHANIVQVFEVGEAAGRPFLALEFVPGGTLAQYLSRQPQPIRLALELTRMLALAIEHAHAQGILHRDLKPGNVLLTHGKDEKSSSATATQFGTTQVVDTAASIAPKITDFGLAKEMHASDGPTEVGAVIGTPSYMAPEQASGVTRTFTPAVDVYALGAILYEMLTGRPPFLGESPTQTVLQVLSQEPVPPRELRPDCPRDLETITLKCLQKNPARRYASALDLADDLRRFEQGEPITARSAGSVERLVKWAKRRPTAAAALLAGFILLAVTALYAWEQRRHGIEMQTLADQERTARQRSEANFQIARRAIKEMLADVGARDLESIPQMDPIRKSLLNKALVSMQELADDNSDNPAVMRQQAQVQFDMGELYEQIGDTDRALNCYREAVKLYETLAKNGKPEAPLLRERILAFKNLATTLMDKDQPDEASSVFDQGLRAADDLEHQWPGEPDNLHVRSRLLLNRGQLLSQMNRAPEGLKNFEQARDDLLKISKEHPDRREYKESLAGAYNNAGVNARLGGRQEEAAKAYQAALDIFKDLAEHYSDNRKYRHSLTIAARNLGSVNSALNKSDDSAAGYETAISGCRQLLKDYPGIPAYRIDLALALTGLGEVLFTGGRPQGMDCMREAVTILEKLATEQPKASNIQYQLGNVLGRIEFVFLKGKNHVEAVRWGDQAVKHLRAALSMNPKSSRYRAELQEKLTEHAQSLLEANQIDDAGHIADELIEMAHCDGNECFEAACLLARCAAKSKDEQARKFGDKAMDSLRRAAESKSIDATKLRNTPELDPLRSRKDFQDLAKQLQPSK